MGVYMVTIFCLGGYSRAGNYSGVEKKKMLFFLGGNSDEEC